MKKLLLLAAVVVCFASCTKQTTWVCHIETWSQRGIAGPYKSRYVTFTGTFLQMKAFEAANTFTDTTNVGGDAPYGAWQTCNCR